MSNLNTMGMYILNQNKEVQAVDSVEEWARMFEMHNRRVDDTMIVEKDNTRVSTVFLGLDHGWGRKPEDPPVVFETMTFSDNIDLNEYQERYSTWDEAQQGHDRIVKFIKNDIPLKEARKTLSMSLKKVPRRFVLGDIHGEVEYLKEVLQKVNFDYNNDILIQIGDIVDRGPEPFLCMDELLKIKNLTLIVGNHDQTFREFINGGMNLLAAYPSNGVAITEQKWFDLTEDQQFYYKTKIFEKMKSYYELDDMLFVHGGFYPGDPIEKQTESYLVWDRDLVNEAYSMYKANSQEFLSSKYKKVFIGHTPTLYYDLLVPFTGGGVTNIDTGCGKGGPLTIMNIDNGDFWQSDYSEQIKQYVILQKTKEAAAQETEESVGEEEVERLAA